MAENIKQKVASDNTALQQNEKTDVQHIFIIGSKSIGQYGGYETFVDRLIGEHENEPSIKYHVACKANGDGYMDESRLSGIKVLKNSDGSVAEFEYKNAHVFKIQCPNIGPGVAIWYDRAAVLYSINYCREHQISSPIFYILTCRIGLFMCGLVQKMKNVGGLYYLNPDGHEWKRAKWPALVRKYWRWSEKKMVRLADLVIRFEKGEESELEKAIYEFDYNKLRRMKDHNAKILSDKNPYLYIQQATIAAFLYDYVTAYRMRCDKMKIKAPHGNISNFV